MLISFFTKNEIPNSKEQIINNNNKIGRIKMSRHPSFGKIGIKKQRNVLKRFERIDALKKDEKYKDGQSVFGLPKTKSE